MDLRCRAMGHWVLYAAFFSYLMVKSNEQAGATLGTLPIIMQVL